MKNWATAEADVNLIMNKHFTPASRGVGDIDKIVLHHNAGNLDVQGCWDVWQTREASAHYQVTNSGLIGQLVWDKDIAWHAGNANWSSIGIEHANNNFGPWTISDATLENGAHLVAALCHLYRLGRPTWMVNVFPHSYYMATGCPGEIAGSQLNAYMTRAQYWYDVMGGSAPVSTPSASSTNDASIEELARLVIRGKYGNGDARKQALGSKYAAVQKRVNEMLGVTQSVVNNKSNEELANEVIRGEWGNGQDRKNRLTSAGYDYTTIQNLVNKKLLG